MRYVSSFFNWYFFSLNFCGIFLFLVVKKNSFDRNLKVKCVQVMESQIIGTIHVHKYSAPNFH